jgi:hypothetical protein
MIFLSASRVKAARLFYLMTVPSYASGQLYRWEILEKAANFRRKKMQKCMAVRIDGTLQYTDEVLKN